LDGAKLHASPAPIRKRLSPNWKTLAERPVATVIRLQNPKPAATILRRFDRSAREAMGIPTSE
jgi:hypothetical protein